MSEEKLLPTLARLEDLEVRLYKVETKSHLRIGAGEGSSELAAAELPLIRALILEEGEEKRVPYLPGSSLHGVIRSWVEKALRSRGEPLGRADLKDLADPDSKDPNVQETYEQVAKEVRAFLGMRPEDDIEPDKVYANWEVYERVCNPLSDVDKCERISGRETERRHWKVKLWKGIGRPVPCDVCAIFGYMGQRGRVKISHAYPAVLEDNKDVPIDIITRVAINRLTGAADEGKLFDLEAIPPGVTFYFFAVLENMGDEQKRAFAMGVRALNLQLAALGAHSTVGFGMVEVSRVFTADVKPGIFEQEVEAILPRILDSGDYELRVDLDGSKYPHFFRALASVDRRTGQPPQERFNGLITFR